MIFCLTDFKPEHALSIIARNNKKLPIPEEKLIQAYLSPGSFAFTLLCNSEAIVCGGIINLDWNNGEAWLLNSAEFHNYPKTAFEYTKAGLALLAKQGKFKRVQAHSFLEHSNCVLLKHLGFTMEALCLKNFGPLGENVSLFAKIFPEVANEHAT